MTLKNLVETINQTSITACIFNEHGKCIADEIELCNFAMPKEVEPLLDFTVEEINMQTEFSGSWLNISLYTMDLV